MSKEKHLELITDRFVAIAMEIVRLEQECEQAVNFLKEEDTALRKIQKHITGE